MKNQLNMLSNTCLQDLSAEELMDVNGGSVFGDLAYLVGATLKSCWVFCRTASEYQSSLPPTLKK